MGFERSIVPEPALEPETHPAAGLTTPEAAKRLARFGPNAIEVRPAAPWWRILVRQFESALILLLVGGAVIAGLVGEVIDAAAIVVIVVLNAVLGFVQEWKAERSLEALRSLLSRTAHVMRDGAEMEIDAHDVVPGDLLVLAPGMRISADGVLVTASDLRIDESVLTGEAAAVAKSERVDPDHPEAAIVAMGTNVVGGRARARVVATGAKTRFGRIAELTTGVPLPPTHLQQTLGHLGKRLAVLAMGLTGLVVAIGWWVGRDLAEMALTGISLAVAVVPEGLPAVVTVTLALGARAMVRRHALSRRLQAIETLGSASIICTDKTGTLTENQMTLAAIWTPEGSVDVEGTGYEPAGGFTTNGEPVALDRPDLADLLTTAMICNNADLREEDGRWARVGEPTEAALVVAAMKAGLSTALRGDNVREIPFSSERKRMSVVSRAGDAFYVHMKGAPEFVLPLCDGIPEGMQAAYHALAERGLRVLALARGIAASADAPEGEIESGLKLLGLVGIFDPPRAEVVQAIADAKTAGIRTIMITGDAADTALAIAHMVGLDVEEAIDGKALSDLSDEALDACLTRDVVFARTAPHHKMRIVERLQHAGLIVAMTGDGVNDAPALKRADIGIAMGVRGTDVAKDASDLVLLDDNFASIVAAIDEGRRQYENVKKFVRYLLCSNGGEVVAIIANLFIGGPLIFQPIQILWMNLVTDGPTALTLGIEPAEVDNMRRPPRPKTEALIGREGMATITLFSLYTGSASLWVFYGALDHGVVFAQTMAFTTMILLEKFSVFAFRSLHLPLTRVGLFSNPWLLAAVGGTVALHGAAIYWPPLQTVLHTTPLDAGDWALMAGLVAPVVVVPEAVKWMRLTRARRLVDPAQGSVVALP